MKDAYYITKPVQPKVIFGFSHLTEEQIRYAAQAMRDIYSKMKFNNVVPKTVVYTD